MQLLHSSLSSPRWILISLIIKPIVLDCCYTYCEKSNFKIFLLHTGSWENKHFYWTIAVSKIERRARRVRERWLRVSATDGNPRGLFSEARHSWNRCAKWEWHKAGCYFLLTRLSLSLSVMVCIHWANLIHAVLVYTHVKGTVSICLWKQKYSVMIKKNSIAPR